ncbi:MAG: DUF3618 domain-containing protein [Propionicimonas sp.]
MTDTVRSMAEIEAEIEAARERLAANLEGLFMQVHPKAIVSNKVAEARTVVSEGVSAVKSELVDAGGNLRLERIGLIAAAIAGSIAFLGTVRSIIRG